MGSTSAAQNRGISCGINKIGIFLRDTQYYKCNVNYLLESEYILKYIIPYLRYTIDWHSTTYGTVSGRL